MNDEYWNEEAKDAYWNKVAKDAYAYFKTKYPTLSDWDSITKESRDHFKGMCQRVVKSVVARAKK